MEAGLNLIDVEGANMDIGGVVMDAAEAYPADRTSVANQALSPDWRYDVTVSLGADTAQGADQSTLFRSMGATADLTLDGTELDTAMPTASSSDAWIGCSHRGSLDATAPTASHFSAACISQQGAERASVCPDVFNAPTVPADWLPEPNAFQGSSGKIHFTLTMSCPSVQTMQSLMEIAILTHARFRIERE